MKKVRFLFVFLLILCFICSLVACNDDKGSDSYSDTYYEYKNGVKQEDSWVKLEKDKWSDDDGASGRLEEKDGVLYGYAEVFGMEDVLFNGTVTDGLFRWTFDGVIYYEYYKDGSYGNSSGSTDVAKIQYTVSFDSNGGSSVMSKKVDSGEKLTAPEQPTRIKYIFNGWYKDSSCTNVWDFDADTVTENITLYAKWVLDETRINAVNGASIDGTDITIIVDDTVDDLDMSDKVVLNSPTATWKLYYDKLGRDEIRTKIATNEQGQLNAGSNLFYIVITSADGTQSKTYVLDLYKRYTITVSSYDIYNHFLGSYETLTLSELRAPELPTIEGYTVTGWLSSVPIGSLIPKDSRGIELTPDCTPNTYQVNLNADGGKVSRNSQNVTFDGEVSFPIPEKTGYSFIGWGLGDSIVTEIDGDCKWKIARDVTLVARYKANRYLVKVNTNNTDAGSIRVDSTVNSVKLSFDLNGVNGDEIETQTITRSTGMRYVVPTANGYLFRGWYKEPSCKNLFDFSKSIAEDTTVYAGWYNYSGTNNSAMAVNASSSSATSTSLSITNTTRYCYFSTLADGNYSVVFYNYYSGSNYGVSVKIYDITEGNYVYTTTYTSTSNYTYNLSGKAGHIYYISGVKNSSYNNTLYTYVYSSAYVPAGGYAGSTSTTTSVASDYGSTATLVAGVNDGYTFTGWYDGTVCLSTKTQYSLTVGAENKTYTAIFIACPITLNKNIDEAGTISGLSQKTVVGDKITITAETNTGYTWLGWYAGDTKVSEGTSLSYTFTMGTESKTYTAKWMACPVVLEKNIAEAGTVNGISKTALGAETTIIAAANAGYTWLGWYDGETKVSEGTSLSYTFTMGTESKTYTAKWSHYTITYNLNGGTNGNNPSYFETFATRIVLEDPSKVTSVRTVNNEYLENGNFNVTKETTAYTFLGWYTESTFENEVTEITYTGSNVVLYAKWSETTSMSTTTTESTYLREGNYVYFGTYPQTIKADNVTITNTTNEKGYYLGSDGYYYAKVTANPCGSGYTFSTGASVTSGTVYYFKVEPIRWRILSEENGELFILCDSIIANRRYAESSNNYANSEIRAWLNETFYNTAFNDLQKALIQVTTVDNSARSTNPNKNATKWNSGNNQYACANTQDKVFLLSEQEVTNSEYGFVSNYDDYDMVREKKNTDYAKCQGAWTSTDSSRLGNGLWWLRSPFYSGSTYVWIVSYINGVTSTSYGVNYSFYGVVPALVIRLS